MIQTRCRRRTRGEVHIAVHPSTDSIRGNIWLYAQPRINPFVHLLLSILHPNLIHKLRKWVTNRVNCLQNRSRISQNTLTVSIPLVGILFTAFKLTVSKLTRRSFNNGLPISFPFYFYFPYFSSLLKNDTIIGTRDSSKTVHPANWTKQSSEKSINNSSHSVTLENSQTMSSTYLMRIRMELLISRNSYVPFQSRQEANLTRSSSVSTFLHSSSNRHRWGMWLLTIYICFCL